MTVANSVESSCGSIGRTIAFIASAGGFNVPDGECIERHFASCSLQALLVDSQAWTRSTVAAA